MSARRLAWLFSGALACAASLPGCADDEEAVCLDVAYAAVNVTVQNPDGSAAVDATVTYSRDGGAFVQPPLRDCDPSARVCEVWGQAGAYVVRAVSADGQRSAERAVTVTKDRCDEPITQRVALVLM